MKTNKWLILLLLVFCRCTKDHTQGKEDKVNEPIQYDERTTISTGECFPIVSDRYVFIVPQTEEGWLQFFEVYDDLYEFSQLSDDVLKSISTPGLIDALIHAPAFLGFFVHSVDVGQYGWHKNYKWFNSAAELFQRKDVGEALLAYYKLVNFDCINLGNNIEDSGLFLTGFEVYARLVGLEALFTKQEVLDNMNHEKKKEAVDFLLKTYNYKDSHIRFRISLMVFLMLADQYEPIVQYAQTHGDEFDIDYINHGLFKPYLDHTSDPAIWDIMVSFAKDFVKETAPKSQ